uniref:trimethyltridecatetraene synthase-like n=1 Tax=Erigeron canadensis TaxID=72917 RepID=UPI001CB98BEA|nr:trimethyltridecatetraene synthase-like [Erigeron canadensis]
MEQYTLVSYAAAAWVAMVVFLVFGRRRSKLNLPPGPKAWPIIGNFNLIGALPHRSTHELAQKYGDLMHLKFGSYDVVMASSVEMAKVFLKTMDANFICRPKTAAGRYTTYNYKNMNWAPYGAYWREARKMFVVELFSAKRLDSFEYVRVEEIRSLMKTIHQHYSAAGKELELKDILLKVNFNVISRMVLGNNYTDELMSEEGFKKMLDEVFILNGVLNVGDWIPWLALMDLQGYVKRMKKVAKTFDIFLERMLNQRAERRNAKDFVSVDMVDLLLDMADDPNRDINLDMECVKGLTMDLLNGGTESSAVSVEWVMAELLKNPEKLEKVTQELDRVIGKDRWVEEKDLVNLPYVKAVMMESMRLHPVAPILIPRRTREDCKVAGYDIPEDTRVFVNVWTIGRDPKVWEKPEEFYPERFIGKDMDVKGNNFELLPFGAGRRMCPGYNLGLKVIQSTLANLIHGFNWKLPGNMTSEDLDMQEVFKLSTPKNIPLVCIAQPRLPLKMY